jgi:selenocysteine lyase/cysteine desulfurase
MPLASQRHLFDIPDDVAYLNCGYMSALPLASLAAAQEGVARKARPWTITPADFFSEVEAARGLFAALLGPPASRDDVALVPAASYGMAVACRNFPLRPGQRVLLLDEEFPSTIYGWRARADETGAEAVMLPRPPDDDWTRSVLDAIDERTAVAALPVCHWTDGGLLNLATIGARLREVGAALVVDATQSLGAMPIDLAAVQPDFLVAAAYKWLLGPYSVGFLYVAPHQQRGTPIEHNWITREGSEDFSALVHYRDRFQPGARRYDVGEVSNFGLLPAAITSLRQLLAWTVPEIYATLAVQTAALAARAAELGLGSVPAARRAGHYLGLRFPAGVPASLPERMARAKIYTSVRGSALRITPHLWNSDADIARLLSVLEESLTAPGPGRR